MSTIITDEEYLREMRINWGEPTFEMCKDCKHDKICYYEYWSPLASIDKKQHILNGTSACDMITCKCKRFNNVNKSS